MPSEAFASARRAASKFQGMITTGDTRLDAVLGGGIRLGVITELVGESASGKTQLALQVSLLAQLPPAKGGLSGATCYLTTNGALPTSRLVELAQEHLLMTPEACNLTNIHTRPILSVSELRHVLSQGLPSLIQRLSKDPSSYPLNLLVLDSMSTLFRSDNRTTSTTLFERSRDLTEIALMLHHLASTYDLAILVINEVNTVFERDGSASNLQGHHLDRLLYREQARWFSRGCSHSSEDISEAGLGLAWANQVGSRVMMTRTGRRRHLSHSKGRDYSTSALKQDVDESTSKYPEESTLIRRLSVVFSSFSSPESIDFAILHSGVVSVSDKLRRNTDAGGVEQNN